MVAELDSLISEVCVLIMYRRAFSSIENFKKTFYLPYIIKLTFKAWCPQESHTFWNKPAAESCRFAQVCLAFLRTPDIKGLITFLRET